MSTDRELLELAAKAAGLRVVDKSHPASLYVENGSSFGGVRWNPLADDGDALRLAVALRLQVIVFAGWVEVLQDGISKSNADSVYDAGCMFSCARRAITRAAAEIGRGMP